MDRQELVRNAVAFLADPNSQSSTISQRIQFLEAKGLTAVEIDDAMRQASLSQSARTPVQSYQGQYHQPVYGPVPYQLSQSRPGQWDWRDYFITAVVSGVVTYGAVSLFKKYLLPHLQPPTATAYEADKDALTAQFDAAETLLKEIQAETAAVRTVIQDQREKVDRVTEDVESAVREMREGEAKTRDEMREVRDEIENIREMLPKMLEKNKETQSQSLAELQQELKSLKALLLSRGPTTPTPASLPYTAKPSIPAWQLADRSSTPSPTPLVSGVTPGIPNGKGKDVDASAPNGTSEST